MRVSVCVCGYAKSNTFHPRCGELVADAPAAAPSPTVSVSFINHRRRRHHRCTEKAVYRIHLVLSSWRAENKLDAFTSPSPNDTDFKPSHPARLPNHTPQANRSFRPGRCGYDRLDEFHSFAQDVIDPVEWTQTSANRRGGGVPTIPLTYIPSHLSSTLCVRLQTRRCQHFISTIHIDYGNHLMERYYDTSPCGSVSLESEC